MLKDLDYLTLHRPVDYYKPVVGSNVDFVAVLLDNGLYTPQSASGSLHFDMHLIALGEHTTLVGQHKHQRRPTDTFAFRINLFDYAYGFFSFQNLIPKKDVLGALFLHAVAVTQSLLGTLRIKIPMK